MDYKAVIEGQQVTFVEMNEKPSYYKPFNAVEGQQLTHVEMMYSGRNLDRKEHEAEIMAAHREEERRFDAITAGGRRYKNEIPLEAVEDLQWRRESGNIHTYQDMKTGGFLHVDTQGQFYDRHQKPVSIEEALENQKLGPEVTPRSHELAVEKALENAKTVAAQQIPKDGYPSEYSREILPASMYRANEDPKVILKDVEQLVAMREESLDPKRLAFAGNLTREDIRHHMAANIYHENGRDMPKAGLQYLDQLSTSIYEYPKDTPREHAATVQPTAEEIKHWQPIVAQFGATEKTEEFVWKASTDTIQSYKHLKTGRYLHIDGETGQFYDQSRNVITREAALEHTLPLSHETSLNTSKAAHQNYDRYYSQHELTRSESPYNTELLEKVLDYGKVYAFENKGHQDNIHSYQHNETLRHIHIDGATGQFYDQERNPITRAAALDHAMPTGYDRAHHLPLAEAFGATSMSGENQGLPWKGETGTIHSYQHVETGRYMHIDEVTRQFYDQNLQPITRAAAFDHVLPKAENYHDYQTIDKALPQEIAHRFNWSESDGSVHSYSNSVTGIKLHIDAKTGQFYDQDRHAITHETALSQASQVLLASRETGLDNSKSVNQEPAHRPAGMISRAQNEYDQGLSL